MPHRQSILRDVGLSNNPNDRSPFYLGLMTFDEYFISLERYVRQRLSILQPSQHQAMLYLSIAYVYGQQSISTQLFAALLGVHLGRSVKLAELMPDATMELLVATGEGKTKWRINHHLYCERDIRTRSI